MSLSHIATLLRESIGLEVETVGVSALQGALRRRMAALKSTDLEEYWAHLQEAPVELRELTEEVVVPETWFFREPDTFAALAALPAPVEGKRRLLSIPCSTGEEAYSLAICGLSAGWSPKSFAIDAVDISEKALVRAQRAVYGKNSFRGKSMAWREPYFRPRGINYELKRFVRECVRFRQGNLLEQDWSPGGASYDVIFCRNLLIYFNEETQERALSALEKLLAPGGLLFVGAAEAFLTQRAGFQPGVIPGSFRARSAAPSTVAPFILPPLPQLPRSVKPRVLPRRPVQPAAPAPPPVAIPAPSAQPSPSLASVSQLADAGRLEEARAECEAYLLDNAVSAEALYLLGLVRDSLGEPEAAETCYRKALYLQPDHPEALRHLALLVQNAGDREGAERLNLRVRRQEEASRR